MKHDFYIKKIQSLNIDYFKKLKNQNLIEMNEYLLYNSPDQQSNTLIIYLNGGGYYIPATSQDDKLLNTLIKKLNSDIILYQYPLAPEFQFPQNIEIAHSYLNDIIKKHSQDYSKIILLGVSSGANLAASLILNYDIIVDGLILISPSLDYYKQNYKSKIQMSNFGLNQEIRDFFKKNYLGKFNDYKNPLISPIYSENFSKLPKTLIHVSELDPLKDEAIMFIKKLGDNHIDYSYKTHETIHNYFNYRIQPFFNNTIVSINDFILTQ